MSAPGVTPIGPLVSTIATGGVAVTVFDPSSIFNTADIINQATATETLYVDVVTTAVAGSETSIPIEPGQAYRITGTITTAVSVVAATSAHAFVAVRY